MEAELAGLDKGALMARGSSQAQTAATSSQDLSNTFSANAENLFGQVNPLLQEEAVHPQGMAPTDLAAADTAAMGSAGGAQSAAVGQGALKAARTRNAGGADAAIASSTRSAGQQLGNEAVGVRLKNAALKQQQQQGGISGLTGLTENQTGAGINALGEVASNVNANTNAENASYDWAKDIMDPLLQAAGASSGTIGKAFGLGA